MIMMYKAHTRVHAHRSTGEISNLAWCGRRGANGHS
jgi:hypothetical protein